MRQLRTQRVKAIFFDLGETLVTQNIEDNIVTKTALQKIAKLLPKRVPPVDLFKLYQNGYRINDTIRSEYNIEIPIYAWIRQLLRRALQEDPTDSLLKKSIDIVVRARAANTVAFNDAHQSLNRISKKQVKLGVISNVSSHEIALGILRKTNLSITLTKSSPRL